MKHYLPFDKFPVKLTSKIILLFVFTSISYLVQAQNCSVNAGVSQSVCENETLFLHGSSAGEGDPNNPPYWSQVDGPSAVIVDPYDMNTEVTNFSPGTLTFRLNGTCEDGSLVFQDVVITVNGITQADAGSDATYCPADIAVMNANSPGTNESGSWAGDVSGTNAGVSVSNSTAPNSPLVFNAARSGTANMVWEITNTNGCVSRDTVNITNRGGVTPIDAGSDQALDHCFSSTQTTTLDASYEGSGIDGQQGTWEVISGPNLPNINNIHSNTSAVSNLIEGTYLLRWNVSGQCVSGADTMQITVPAPTADVTTVAITNQDPVYCDQRTSIVLEGNQPLYINETVEWTQVSGPAGVTIVDPNSPITQATGLDGSSTYVFLYTITNSVTGCNDEEQTTVSYMLNPPSIDITEEHIYSDCGETSASIEYTYGGDGTNQYSILSGPELAGVTYPTDWENIGTTSPALINGLDSAGTYTIQFRRHTTVNSACNNAYDQAEVTISLSPPQSNAGTFQILNCHVTTTHLIGNNPSPGNGTWSQVSGPSPVTLDSIHNTQLLIENLSNGLYKFQWLISGGPMCDDQADSVSVLVSNVTPTQVSAGDDTTFCYLSPVHLNAERPNYIFEFGTWSIDSNYAFTGVNIVNKHYSKTEVTGLQADSVYRFIWIIQNGCGNSVGDTVQISINNNNGPIQAVAGDDQCLASGTTTIQLDGNDPGGGDGLWTQITSLPGTITDDQLYNTTVTGVTDGTYQFEWLITDNVNCGETRDTVTITIGSTATADAGSNIELCGDSTRLNGNNPAPGTGLWTQISGNSGDTIRTPDNNITDVINLQSGNYKFQWEVTDGGCVFKDTVTVFVTYPPGDTAHAGPDQTICGTDTTSMAANDPVNGNGLWTLMSGPTAPTIVNSSSATTKIEDLGTGDYSFIWTISVGGFCPPSKDTMEITVTLPADAGADQEHCDVVNSVNLVGTTNSVGYWYQVGNWPTVATIDSTSPNTATASNLDVGTYEFVYAVDTGGSCESRDTMTVSLYDPASMADAGPDQELCQAPIFFMDADPPASNNDGKWTKLSGPAAGSFVDDTDPTTEYQNPDPGVYVFEWTVSNQQCSNADQVRITNYEQPTTPDAGPDQTHVCDSVVVMAGNTITAGVGVWSIDTASIPSGKTPVIQSPVQPETEITDLVPDTWPGTYKFVWTTTNGVCDTLRDTVAVTVYEPPTKADAGVDQELCNQDITVLTGNTISVGQGTWTVEDQPAGGAVSFVDIHDPNTTISGLNNAFGTYKLAWTSDNSNGCTSADTVLITNYETPTTADASATTNELCLYDPMTLEGNTPTVGTGTWTQVSGSSVTILNPNSPTTDVVGVVADTYQFAWTITNGVCTASADTVQVVVNPIPSQALAGPDQELCGATSATLDGNSPTGGSTGTWSQHSGPTSVSFVDAHDPTTDVTGLSPDSPAVYYLVWTHNIGICTKSDTMKITVWEQPSVADAGTDQQLCNSANTTMAATTPAVGSGEWSQASGPNTATIDDPASATTDISNLVPGTYEFVFTNTNGNCPPERDTVDIINYSDMQVSGPGDTTICKGGAVELTVTATGGSGSYTYQWQQATTDCNGTWNDIPGATSDSYTTPFLNSTGDYYYHCVVSDASGTCSPVTSDCGTVTVVDDPTITSQSGDQEICVGTSADFSVTVSGGTGSFNYQWQSATSCAGPWTDISGETNSSYNTGTINTDGDYYYHCVIAQSGVGCDTLTSNCMHLTVYPDPQIDVDPVGNTICSGTTHTMSVTASGGSGNFNYNWQISTTGTGGWSTVQNTTSNSYTTDPLTETRYYRVEVIDNVAGCNDPVSSVAAVHVPRITTQPVGDTICDGGIHTMTLDADSGSATLTYQWQLSNSNSPYSWSNVGTNSKSYTTAVLTTGSYYYRCVITVTSPNCSDLVTDTAEVKVKADPIIATQPEGDTICNGDTHTMTVVPQGGVGTFNYQWQESTTDCSSGWADIAGATSNSYTTPALTQTTYYRCIVGESGVDCNTNTSDCATVLVNNLDAGEIAAEQTLCEGTTLAALTSTTDATAEDPNAVVTYQWEESTDGTNFSDISGETSTGYAPGALTQDRWYRRKAISTLGTSVCTEYSNVIHIWINNISAGTISSDQTLCEGSTPATLTGTVPVTDGSVSYLWEESPDGINYTLPAGTIDQKDFSPGALTADTWYRRIDFSTLNGVTCTDTTNVLKITIINFDPGTIADNDTVCEGGTPALITSTADASGDGTFTYQWQSKTATTAYSDIAGATSTTYQPGTLTEDTWFRRVATATVNGQTCSDNSNEVKVTVNNLDPGAVAASQEICYEGIPDQFTSTTDATGDGTITYQWEISTDNTTYNVIAGATSSTYQEPNPLTADTWYRRVAYSQLGTLSCSDIADTLKVTVVPDPAITTQPVNDTICSGSTTTLTVVADYGTPSLNYEWQESTSNSPYAWTATSGGSGWNTSSYTTPALTDDRYYRVVITATGNGCNTVISDTVAVVVNNITNPGTIADNQTICEGSTPNTLTGTDATGDGTLTYRWQDSPDGITYTDIAGLGATSKDYSPGALTADTWYRRIVTSALGSQDCYDTSNVVQITVNNVTGGAITADQEVCALSEDPAAFTETGASTGDGTLTYQWQMSSDNVTFTDITGATSNTYDSGSLADTTWFKRITTSTLNGQTCTAESNTLVINANDCPSIDLVKSGTIDDGGDGMVDAGDHINYTFTVTNTGNVTLTNVHITDPDAVISGGPLASLAAGAVDNSTFTGIYTITQADLDAGTFTNTATVTGTSPKNVDVTAQDSDTQTFDQEPAIQTTKTATSVNGVSMPTTYATAGDVISYLISLKNTGNITVYNPSMTDPGADSGPTYILGDNSNSGVLDVGETWVYSATHIVTQQDIDTSLYINTATGTGSADTTGDGTGDTTLTSYDRDTVHATQTPSVVTTKTVTAINGSSATTKYSAAGDVITYQITFANNGNVTVYNPTMTDPDADTGPAYTSGDADSDGVLDVGETWVYTATHNVSQADMDNGSFTNTATGNGSADTDGDASGDTPVSDSDNEMVEANQNPEIVTVKTAQDINGTPMPTQYSAVGDVINYQITLENSGNITVYNPVMSDSQATSGPTYSSGDANTNNILDVGETWVYTASRTVTLQDIENGSIINTATGTGSADTTGDGTGDTTLTSHDNDTVYANQNPSVAVTKTAQDINGTAMPTQYTQVGDVITYEITFENNGNVTVYNPDMNDPQATTGPTYQSGDVSNAGVLDVGETWVYTATRTVTQLDLDRGVYINTATGTGSADTTGDGNGNVTVTDSDNDTVHGTQTESVDVTKTVTAINGNAVITQYSVAGDVISYQLTLENTGNVTVYDPAMSDPGADANPAYSSGDSNGDGVLDVGETWIYTATHTVTQQDIDRGHYTNTATGSGSADTDGDGNGDTPVSDNDSKTVNATQTPSVDVVKTVTAINGSSGTTQYSSAGDIITYQLTLENDGNVTVYNPAMSDPGADTGPTYVSGDTDNDGVLDVGEIFVYTATHTVTQQDVDNGSYTNVATGNGSADTDGDGTGDTPVSDNDTKTVEANQTPSILTTKTATAINGSAATTEYTAVGDVISYSITLQNNGNITVYSPAMSDPLVTSGPDYSSGDINNNHALDVGETWVYTASYTVTQQDLDNGSFTNVATGTGSADTTGDGTGDTTLTSIDNEVVNAAQNPHVTTVKTATQINGQPMPGEYTTVGDVISYLITFKNDGNVTVYTPTMTDPDADNGPTYVIGDSDGDGALDVGETWIYSASHNATQLDIDRGYFTNTATGTGSADTTGDGTGDITVTDSDNETVNATQNPGMVTSKTAQDINGTPMPAEYTTVGDVITYEITLENSGNITIYNPVMTDPKATTGPDYSSGDNGNNILDVGETWIYTATRTVTQQDLDNGEFINTVTGTGSADTTGDGTGDTTLTVHDNDTVQATQNPAVAVTKTATDINGTAMPAQYTTVGDVITYEITFANTGNITVYNPNLTDSGADNPPAYQSGDVANTGVLDVGETWIYTATHTVTQQDLDNGNYLNTATGTGSADTTGDHVGDTTLTAQDTANVNATQNPSIVVVKTADSVNNTPMITEYTTVGDELHYTITLTNDGNITVYNPNLSDSGSDNPPAYQSGDVANTGVLDVGETWIYTATHTVTQQDLDNGNYLNTATGTGSADTTGDHVGDTTLTAQDTANVNATQNPSIVVVKTADSVNNTPMITEYTTAGDELHYTITLTNDGNITVYNPNLSDSGSDNPPAYQSGDVTNTGVLDVGETWIYTATHTVTQQDLDNGNYLNTATGTGSADTTGDHVGDTTLTAQDTANVNATQTPSIVVVKTADSVNNTPMITEYTTAGDELHYTITLTNDGNITVYNPNLTDSGSDNPPAYQSGDVANTGVLDVGETWIYTATHTVTQQDLDNGNYLNTATGTGSADTTGDGSGDKTLTAQDTANINAAQSPGVAVTKTATDINGNAMPVLYSAVGDTINYEITFTNTGNITVYNPVMTDADADVGPDYVSGDVANTGVLDVGETWVYAATHYATQQDLDSGTFVNMAIGVGSADTTGDGSGDVTVTDFDRDTVHANQMPELELVKTITSGSPYSHPGDTIKYSYSIKNVGNITLDGAFSVTDDRISNIPDGAGPLAPQDSVMVEAWYVVTVADMDSSDITNIAFATDINSGLISPSDTAVAPKANFGCQFWISCHEDKCLTTVPLMDTVMAGVYSGSGNCPGNNSGTWTNPQYPGSAPVVFNSPNSDTTTFEVDTPGIYTLRYTWPDGTYVQTSHYFYEPPKPVISGDTAVSTCNDEVYTALDGRNNTFGDLTYQWYVSSGGTITGSDSSQTVTVHWDNVSGNDTLIVNSHICVPCQCMADCEGWDTIVVTKTAPRFAGQVKYWNQYETYMPSPFATEQYYTTPFDYFYVTLYHVNGSQYDSLATAYVQPKLMENLEELMSYFEFDINTDSFGCDAEYVLKVWDGGLCYHNNPPPPEEETNLGGAYTYRNWGGVNATDALAIQLMAAHSNIHGAPWNYNWVGPVTDSPYYGYYSHAIADVNSSNTYANGGITALDALTAKYRAVGLIGNYPHNGAGNNQFSPNFRVTGRLVDSLPQVTFPKPFDYDTTTDVPFTHSGTDYLYFTKATAHKYTSVPISMDNSKDFINIYYESLGDINAGYIPPGSGLKALPTAILVYENSIQTSLGEEITIPVKIDRNAEVGAITISMDYRNDLIEVLGTSFGEDGEYIDARAGTLNMAWFSMNPVKHEANDVIATIKVKVIGLIPEGTQLFKLRSNTELADGEAHAFDVQLKTVTVTTNRFISGDAELQVTNYPNPFDTKTTFKYVLPENGKVKLEIYDLRGKHIATLVDKVEEAGTHIVEFTRTAALQDGIYVYHLSLAGEENSYAVVKKFNVTLNPYNLR